MYKAAVRAMVRHTLNRLNAGDPSLVLRMAAPDAELIFPGDNSWSTMFRPAVKDRQPHVTHRGRDECAAFAQRFVDNGLQFQVEDIVVNGPPWNLRVAVRAHDYIEGPDGTDAYNNRVMAWMEMRWGRLVRWEDYEDTERSAAWDAARAAAARTA